MSQPDNIILVPTDFTEQCRIALGQSYNLAKFMNAKIVLLYVIDGATDVKDPQSILDTMAQEAGVEAGIPIETMIVKGNVYKEIVRVSEELNAALVVMGLNTQISLNKIIGQNAFKLVRESKIPVITIKGQQHRPGCQNIILPLDLTKETREKVGKAIEFAKYFHSAIRIISILSQKDEESENRLIAYANQVRDFIQKKGIRCSIKTLRGSDIAKMVIDYANEEQGDLIMIMSKQELSLKEFFIGTAAQQIINQSNIPVLSLRPVQRKDTTTFASPY